MSLARGIRNNNPLNIRRTDKDQWKGMAEKQTDPTFCQFTSMEWGWRAAFCLLIRTYYSKYQLSTIRAIVSRWAPATENNTPEYIANVSHLSGIGPDEPLGDPSKVPSHWQLLAAAMAIQENGRHDLDLIALLRGWELCLNASFHFPTIT